jgi:hypothetical protein
LWALQRASRNADLRLFALGITVVTTPLHSQPTRIHWWNPEWPTRAEDSFEVYLGRIEYPLEAAPVWRYMAKDALNGPKVKAVEQFHNAIDESEKQHQQKP